MGCSVSLDPVEIPMELLFRENLQRPPLDMRLSILSFIWEIEVFL